MEKTITIGQYIVTIDGEEHFIVKKEYEDTDMYDEVRICGGDFETLLESLFIHRELRYKRFDGIHKLKMQEVELLAKD